MLSGVTHGVHFQGKTEGPPKIQAVEGPQDHGDCIMPIISSLLIPNRLCTNNFELSCSILSLELAVLKGLWRRGVIQLALCVRSSVWSGFEPSHGSITARAEVSIS